MKSLDKFIIKSYIGPLVTTFFIVIFILMLNFLWRYIDELVGRGLPMAVIMELIFYATITLVPMGLPLSALLAGIMTMGNLGENNELLAMKAAGIPLQRILKPLIWVTIIVAIANFFVINNLVPYSFQKMNMLLTDIRSQRQQIEFKDGIFFDGIPNIAIKVDHQDPITRLLENVIIYDNRSNEQPNTIVADSGYITISDDKNYLQMTLFQGNTYEGNRSFRWYDEPHIRHHKFDNQQLLIELDGFNFERSDDDAFGDRATSKNISELMVDIDSLESVVAEKNIEFSQKLLKTYIFSFDTTIVQTNDSIQALRSMIVTRKNIGFDTLSIDRKSEILNKASTSLSNMRYYITGEHDKIRRSAMSLYDSYISVHEKLSLPVSIIIFFLIGSPLGAIIRKGGLGMPIVISVAFFVVYYIITITGKKLVSDGAWSPYAGMWLSTFILGPLAAFLTYKSTTDSPLMDAETYSKQFKKVLSFVNNIKKIWNKKA